MGSFSDYLEVKLLNATLRGIAYSSPATTYVALFTSSPTDTGSGGTEVAGSGYARVALSTPGSFSAPTSGAGSTSNAADITFPTATATWGTITYFGIYDAATAGNLLYYGALAVSKVINSGDNFRFPTGTLVASLD